MYKICIKSYMSVKQTLLHKQRLKNFYLIMSNLRNILMNKISCKSVWFMRQAGRYLPEFRKIRKQNKNFIKLCLNSKLS